MLLPVAKINSMIADRNNEMESLQVQIEQLEGSVLEREMIHEIQSQSKDAQGDSFKRASAWRSSCVPARRRTCAHARHSPKSTVGRARCAGFEELHMKRKLQTLVGMQTQEIGLLRDELDRLRRRTFPTFTHIDNRASADRAAL